MITPQELAEKENRATKEHWTGGEYKEMHRRIAITAEGSEEARKIMAECVEVYGITMKDLIGQDRSRPLVTIRQECMAEIHRSTDMSIANIGRLFHRDHTTVSHAIRRSDWRAGK